MSYDIMIHIMIVCI